MKDLTAGALATEIMLYIRGEKELLYTPETEEERLAAIEMMALTAFRPLLTSEESQPIIARAWALVGPIELLP